VNSGRVGPAGVPAGRLLDSGADGFSQRLLGSIFGSTRGATFGSILGSVRASTLGSTGA
jgi:hypothetical protein